MSIELYIALFLLAYAVTSYIILDGGDLGIGMLMPLNKNKEQEYLLQNIIVTVWDANESWIILTGTLLWGALPGAYATLLPQLYPYFVLIVLGFILRALAMEFSDTRKEFVRTWRFLFVLASWMSALAQGLIAANLIGNFIDPTQLNTFLIKILITSTVVLLYIINGMNFQVAKTVGNTRKSAIKYGKISIVTFMLSLSILAIFLSRSENLLKPFEAGFRTTMTLVYLGMIILQLGNFYLHLKKGENQIHKAIYLTLGTNILLVVMALLFIHPNITPELSIIDAANPSSSSMWFLVIGVCLCIPIVTWYNTFATRIFKGKHKYIAKED